MPDPIEEFNNNLSPKVSEKTTEKVIQMPDGTYRVISRETVRIVIDENGLRRETSNEATMDDLGNPIHSQEDVGGICHCGNLAHKDHFFVCGQCGMPLCRRCATMIRGRAYCSWCSMVVSLRRLFSRRERDE